MSEQRRYPLEPLAAAIGEPFNALGRLLGLSGSSWTVVRDRGVTERTAERYAVKLGIHPYVVWPEMVAEAEVECAWVECSVRFVPTRANHRCCSKACAKKIWARTPAGKASLKAAHKRWKESVPAYAARVDREYRARWREENRERERARNRAYYQATQERQRAARRERYARQKEAA